MPGTVTRQPAAVLPRVGAQKAQRPTPGSMPRVGRTGGTPAAPKIAVGITEHQATPAAKPAGQHQAVREAAARKVTGAKALAKGAGKQAPAKTFPTFQGAPATQQGLNPMHEYDTGKYDSPAQIAGIAKNIAQREAATDLQPLRQQATETGSAEQNALARNAAMGATGQQTLAGLQAGEEASAKTGENNAAEAAIQAANAIRSSGAAGATATGGLGPQSGAALAETSTQAGALGGAASQYQGAMGVSTPAEMAQLRAAAAQRVTEGGTRLQEGYGVAQERNTGEQDKILAKQDVDTEKEDKLLGEEQTKDRVALADVGVKEGTLKADETKNANTLKTDEVKNKVAAQNDTEKNAATREKTNATLQASEVKNANSIRTAEIKAKASLEVANKKAGRLTTSEEDKAIGELGSAFATIQQLRGQKVPLAEIREGLNKGSLPTKVEGKASKEKINTVKNQVIVKAAEELWNYHKVSAATKTQLRAQGIEADSLNLFAAVGE